LTAVGTLAGVQRAGVDPAIVWFDAHGDLHTLSSSTSGYLGGMALRMILGGDPDQLTAPLGMRPAPEERAVLVGARDLDPAEVDYLASSRVRRLPVEEITADLHADVPLLVHLDLDVIDADEVPGLRFPARNGPSTATVAAAVRRLTSTRRVAALDIGCPWHPPGGPQVGDLRTRLLARLLLG
jgi:arginase